MVQVLPYVPSPLEQLTPYISQAAGQIGSGIGQHYRNKADQSILQQIQGGQVSASDIPPLWAQLSPETRKTYEPFIQSQLRTQESSNKERAKSEIKHEFKEKESESKKENLRGVVSDLEELKPYAGSTKNPLYLKTFNAHEGGLNRAGLEKRAEIDSLAITLEGVLRDISTKGALPKRTFEVLLEKIPKSTDSERVYQGKLNAFKKILKSAPQKVQEEVNASISKPQDRPPLESFYQ